MNTFALSFAALLAATPAFALDGKWTPEQVLEIDPAWLHDQGLELTPSQLWDAKRGTGLLTGTVRIGGCSGAFVSADGLIVTNHHCLFPLIQEHSTPERDLISQGFLARERSEELAGSTLRVEIPRRFTDVSAKLLAAIPAESTPLARLDAIEAQQRELIKQCETQADTKCSIAVADEGVSYTLIESIELRDVRLVYAPPRAIGEYGGEIDNWMWPRHTGDFSIARAYAGKDGKPADRSSDNRPYKPEFIFPISKQGVAAKDFVMVLGFPGVTYRSLLAEEMRERRERFFVRREQVFSEWIDILESASKNDPAGTIAVAANVKSIANRHKNAQGQIAGLDRGLIVDKQMATDNRVAEWAAQRPEYAAALTARSALREILAERELSWEHDFLLNLIPMGMESMPGGIPPLPKALYFGATLAHNAIEFAKPDGDRASDYSTAHRQKLRDQLRREQRNYFNVADQQLFVALIQHALALPEDQRIKAVDEHFGQLERSQIGAHIKTLYAQTTLLDADAREHMLTLNLDQLQQRADPLLDFAIGWNRDLRALREHEREWASRSAIHRPIWRQALRAQTGQPIAPDANSSLRISFAHVQGYAPRDGVRYTPFTTLNGALEKHTGQEPFNLPESTRAAARAPGKRWLQKDLNDLPINFLADGDTSGGNSGSPVVNAMGELVGINFDRVWENVAGDFGFNPALSRNVSVDIRYLLWLLDRVEHADELLRELGVQREI